MERGFQNDSEDAHARDERGLGFRYTIGVVENFPAEPPEVLSIGFHAELDAKNRCQGHPDQLWSALFASKPL